MLLSRPLLAVGISLLFAACQGREQPYGTGPDNAAADKDAGAASLSLAGVYADTVPCNDCQGIATRLTLKPDSLYELQEAYLGRPDPVNYRRGPWRVRGQVVTLPPSGNAPVRRYQVEAPRQLRLLDADGKPMQAANADYTLNYQSDGNLNEAGTTREFTGLYSAQSGTAVFTECGSDKRYTLAAGSLASELESRYATVRQAAGKQVFLRVSATVSGAGEQETLAVGKILEMKPDAVCPQAAK
jgi:copper homeostasis protein (lipoprotein)